MNDRIAAALDDRVAFIPYLVAGDPGTHGEATTPDEASAATKRYVEALVAGGANIIELGLPFSEPIAEGPTIRTAITRALEYGMTPRHYMDLVADLSVDVPIVVMTYYNLIYRFGDEPGVESFVDAAAEAGISGMIVPDLPVEESEPLARACADRGLDLIFIAAPTTRDDRLERILETGSGYLYVQARLGTTGARTDVSDQTQESLARIRQFEDLTGIDPVPKAVGFGISSGDHAETVVAAGADGIIVGSALVDQIAAAADVQDAAQALKADAQEYRAGANRGRDRRTGNMLTGGE